MAISTDGLVPCRYRPQHFSVWDYTAWIHELQEPIYRIRILVGLKVSRFGRIIFTSTGNHESNHQQLTVIYQYSILYGSKTSQCSFPKNAFIDHIATYELKNVVYYYRYHSINKAHKNKWNIGGMLSRDGTLPYRSIPILISHFPSLITSIISSNHGNFPFITIA